MINKTLAILAGGKSSRMNYNNKALLSYKEKTFIENIIEYGCDFKEVIIIANNKDIYKDFGVRVVSDIFKGNGPLSGIHSALYNSRTDYVLCVACDMPLITKEVLNFLGNYGNNYEVLIPMVKGRLQPLCSIYSKDIIGTLEQSIEKHENKLQNIILNLNYKVVKELEYKEREFYNFNTPNDLKILEEK